MTKCYECEKGSLARKEVEYGIYGVKLGRFPAEVCSRCGEVFFSEEVSKKINHKAKQLGLWGLETKSKIGQAGSALDIRLSKKLVEFLKLKKGKEVKIYPENRQKLVVEI